MGNIFQCCRALSDYFKRPDASAQGGTEHSRLLSSEESECDSWSPTYNLEDDLFTVSTGVANPILEPDHFLFPDIILSSSLGGEVTLVEPMVCLLVSEEEEGLGGNDLGGEDVRSIGEIQTQTEAQTLQRNKKETDEVEGGQRLLEGKGGPQTSQSRESDVETEQKIKKSKNSDLFSEENTLNQIKTTSTHQLQQSRELQEDSGVFEMEQHPD